MSEVDRQDELHDLLLSYLDGVAPVRPDDVRSSRPRQPFVRTAAVASCAVVFVCLVLVAALLAVSNGSRAPAGTLQATNGGPCPGSPPGCGSPLGSAAALAAGRWTTFPSGPLSSRSGQMEIWTGKELIVWGGRLTQARGSVVTSDGAAYDPATRTWQMLPASPLAARENAAVAWTGSEIVVVGGDNGKTVFADGATYDPATNAWTVLRPSPLGPITTATAIWTGRQLVVLGGVSSLEGYPWPRGNDGVAAFGPLSRVWTRLADISAPGGRRAFDVEAAWTGSALIAFLTYERQGSTGSFVNAATVELTSGATSWRPLAAPRPYMTVSLATIWTGSSMIDIGTGGCFGTCPPKANEVEGAEFYPGADEWGPLPFSDAPAEWPAVWTGRSLIEENSVPQPVLGQPVPNASVLGAFDASLGEWVALPQAPGGDEAQAVWTGSQLLVWGQPAEVLTARLDGTVCGYSPTNACPTTPTPAQ